ncbi:hypothetical protein BGX28_002631 [Mortierella sp. GBA30]|nr:hypothetical protein BGX28_002631 [Mortierella sp. GBA30]
MKLTATLALLSVVAITSATKLQSAFNKLCLDASYGFGNGAGLYMGPCNQLKHGDWQILQSGERVWLINNEEKGANGGHGWCVDWNPSRSGSHPTVWACNDSDAQRFIRFEGTREGRWSFMTKNAISRGGRFELSGSSNNANWGSQAEFGAEIQRSQNEAGDYNYEWYYLA